MIAQPAGICYHTRSFRRPRECRSMTFSMKIAKIARRAPTLSIVWPGMGSGRNPTK